MIARSVFARGSEPAKVAGELVDVLAAPDLVLALVFADWRLDPATLARELQRGLGKAPVVGGTSVGVISAGEAPIAAAAGFYGDWLRVGIGVAPELSKSALPRSRDAVHRAAAALGAGPEALDPQRHVALTLVDGKSGHEEAFCIGSAAAAPQIRFVGGAASTEHDSTRRSYVWTRGEAIADAGVVLVLESALPFEVVHSMHLVATDARTVVTAASGREIHELDGRPAAEQLHRLVAELGGTLDDARPTEYSFARYVDGVPYIRSLTQIEGTRIHLASAVETGHVLRLMQPGDLIGQTRRDLAAAAEQVGGRMSALLAFSCLARHWEAAARGLEGALAAAYAEYPTTGFQSYGEQTGMLLVNHTLTGLALGDAP